MVEAEPRVINADVDEVLAALRRMLPSRDPVHYLATQTGVRLLLAKKGSCAASSRPLTAFARRM